MALEVEQAQALPRMTEAEFEAWCDEDTRAEFVDGKVISIAPVSLSHLDVNDFLKGLLRAYLRLRPVGRCLGPEFTVRLRGGLRRVPDLLFVATERLTELNETHFEGAPDAAWEIISPDSERRDWREKFQEYEAAGVTEYWIINPLIQTAYLHRLGEDGRYAEVEEADGRLVSVVLPGFWIKPEWLWQRPLPWELDCIREMGLDQG